MKDYTVEQINTGRKKLADLCAAFGVDLPPPGSEGMALSLVIDGRLFVGDDEESAVYTLAVPVDLRGSGKVEKITLTEPDQRDIDVIHRGIRVTLKGDERITELSDVDTMTSRVITRIGGQPLAVAERIKRRDLAAMQEVFGLLGFFG